MNKIKFGRFGLSAFAVFFVCLLFLALTSSNVRAADCGCGSCPAGTCAVGSGSSGACGSGRLRKVATSPVRAVGKLLKARPLRKAAGRLRGCRSCG